MPDYKIETVGNGAEIIAVPADRFKTNELSISFFMPLSNETAAVNAVVPICCFQEIQGSIPPF